MALKGEHHDQQTKADISPAATEVRSAMPYADSLSADLRQVLVRLSDLWGDTGHARGGVFEDLIDYVVIKLTQDIAALPE